MTGFTAPPCARKHCRHYHFVLPITRTDSGPSCAVGIDLSAPAASLCCMPPKDGQPVCDSREDWTDAERAAWDKWAEARQKRLIAAIAAVPHPIPVNTSGVVLCPNCAGQLGYARWHRGGELGCSTEGCCGARFSIEAGKDWPVGGDA
jgi:hypothetical protein